MKSISVVMATFNSERVLEKCLKSIRDQNFNQKKIEIVVADGGSTDGTLEILKKFNTKIIPERTGSPESAKAIALRKAKSEIILFMASDNILPDRNWLKTMAALFEKEPKITGCYPWRYSYKRKDNSLNRYFSLLGANDPMAYFLGKADRQSYFSNKWDLAGEIKDKGNYFLVEFNTDNMPTLGDNGFLIKRDILMKAEVDEEHFFHIDVCLDLVEKGFNKFAVFKNNIIHDTGESFIPFIKKRYKYMKELYLRDLSKRRYRWSERRKDKFKILLFSIYSLTLVGPFLTALRGYVKKPDLAWFWHSLMCLGVFWAYTWALANHVFSHVLLTRQTACR